LDLLKLAAAVKELGRPRHGFSLCIYGPPKVGKTRLAATIAKVKQIKRVFLVDIENGHETLITMLREGILNAEEAAKIQVIRVYDTAQRPLASETILKMLTVRKPQLICEGHGKISCTDPECKGTGTLFNIADLGQDDVFILDSASALTTSVLNYHLMDKDRDYKAGWDEYGPQGRDLDNIFLVIQACQTNFIVVTHTNGIEGIDTLYNKEKGDFINIPYEEMYPLVGTKNYSRKVGKFFSHIIYMHMAPGKHAAGSSSTYKHRTITGSRGGWRIERSADISLASIFDQLYHVPEGELETTTAK
jgi:hypothetical protein